MGCFYTTSESRFPSLAIPSNTRTAFPAQEKRRMLGTQCKYQSNRKCLLRVSYVEGLLHLYISFLVDSFQGLAFATVILDLNSVDEAMGIAVGHSIAVAIPEDYYTAVFDL